MLDALRPSASDRHSFPSVPRTKWPPAHAGGRLAWSEPPFFSSGDRIRTCDLWVMSEPVPVPHHHAGLKRAGHDQSPVQAITPRSTSSRQVRRVSFTNPFTTFLADVGRNQRDHSRRPTLSDVMAAPRPNTTDAGVPVGWRRAIPYSPPPQPVIIVIIDETVDAELPRC